MNVETLDRACDAIGALTPMLGDCGALCGAACCQTDADGQGGVHLFPGNRRVSGTANGWSASRPAASRPS